VLTPKQRVQITRAKLDLIALRRHRACHASLRRFVSLARR